jgi:hypothetical protein
VRVGNTATEARQLSLGAGQAGASKYVAVTGGSTTRLRVFLDAGTSAGTVLIGLYSNTATNHPGALLASGTVTGATPNTQNVATLTTPVSVTTGQTYWIAVLGPTGKTNVRLRNAVGAGSSETSSQKNLTTLPSTWTTGGTSTQGLMSAVATS